MIAPTFESLSTKYSKPKKITFCKVDVDNQQAVAQMYSVRAMPTFLVLHNGSVVQTVQGANPPALAAAVEKGVKLAGAAAGPAFGSGGQRLGGSGVTPAAASRSLGRPVAWDLRKLIDAVVTFFGLYFVSLFSVSAIVCFLGCELLLTKTIYSLTPIKLLRIRSSTRRTLHHREGQAVLAPVRSLRLGGRAASRRWRTWAAADGGLCFYRMHGVGRVSWYLSML